MSDTHDDWSHVIARERGDGAANELDEQIDVDSIQPHDGRAKTRTTFIAAEADENQDMWKRLAILNDDYRHPDRAKQNWRADKRRMVQTFCQQLDMTQHQRDRVQFILDTISINSFGSYTTEHVILATISIVANEDGRWVYEEEDERIDDYKNVFRKLLVSNDITNKELRRVRNLTRDRMEEAGL